MHAESMEESKWLAGNMGKCRGPTGAPAVFPNQPVACWTVADALCQLMMDSEINEAGSSKPAPCVEGRTPAGSS